MRNYGPKSKEFYDELRRKLKEKQKQKDEAKAKSLEERLHMVGGEGCKNNLRY